MFPLIPRGVPNQIEGGWIEPELQLATHIAAQRPILIKIAITQWHMEPPAPELRGKRDNATSEECLSVTGRLASNQQGAKSAVRKYGRGFGAGQQRVVAGAQFRLTDYVESPLQRHALAARSSCRLKFQVA